LFKFISLASLATILIACSAAFAKQRATLHCRAKNGISIFGFSASVRNAFAVLAIFELLTTFHARAIFTFAFNNLSFFLTLLATSMRILLTPFRMRVSHAPIMTVKVLTSITARRRFALRTNIFIINNHHLITARTVFVGTLAHGMFCIPPESLLITAFLPFTNDAHIISALRATLTECLFVTFAFAITIRVLHVILVFTRVARNTVRAGAAIKSSRTRNTILLLRHVVAISTLQTSVSLAFASDTLVIAFLAGLRSGIEIPLLRAFAETLCPLLKVVFGT